MDIHPRVSSTIDFNHITYFSRVTFLLSLGADLFISFHVNAHSNASVNGTSVYYSKSNNNVTDSGLSSSILATEIAKRLSTSWSTKNNGILADKFVVIHNNSVPAVLVECGFITNSDECEKLSQKEYQKQLSSSIVCGIIEYIEKTNQ